MTSCRQVRRAGPRLIVGIQHDRQPGRTELDRIACLQQVRLSQRVIVYQGAILAAEVLQPVPAIAELDAGMVPREASIRETDRILRQAAKGCAVLTNIEK